MIGIRSNKLVLDQRLSPEEKNLLAGEFERREQESSKGFEKFRERYKAIEDMIGAVKPELAKLGFKSETEGIRHLLQHNQNYSQNPVGYVANLIEKCSPARRRFHGSGPTLRSCSSRGAAADVARGNSGPDRAVPSSARHCCV
jgi:hypothetical protein